MKKEKQEILNINNSIIEQNNIKKTKTKKSKKENNILSYDLINIKSIYFFFLKTFFKGWYLWIFFIIFISSFIMSFIFCLLISKNVYYYLGLDFITLINTIVLTTFFCFNCISYFKFTDLQNRIKILNLKNLGYLFIFTLVILTYVIVSDIVTNIVFIGFSILYNISFWTLYNWTLIFFLLFSFMIMIILIIFYFWLISILKSLKSALLIGEMIINFILVFSYLLYIIDLLLFNKINTNDIFTSMNAFLYYLLITGILITLISFSIYIFKKKFILKR